MRLARPRARQVEQPVLRFLQKPIRLLGLPAPHGWPLYEPRTARDHTYSAPYSISAAAAVPRIVDTQGEYGQLRSIDVAREKQTTSSLDWAPGEKAPSESALQYFCYTPSVPSLYGKWKPLSRDSKRLAFETDFDSPPLHDRRLVDLPEHAHDIELWSCLFDFCHRRHGRYGAWKIWKEILRRRNLFSVEGAAAVSFWRKVNTVALEDEMFLEKVWDYAEWLLETHEIRWPDLYQTTVAACLSDGRYERAFMWHLRLSPNLDPGPGQFADFMKTFILDSDPDLQETLRFLYTTSVHHTLYDVLIPYIFAQGHSAVAREWRLLFLQHNDIPRSLAARPFLRFMAGYHGEQKLTEEEQTVAGLEQPRQVTDSDTGSDAKEQSLNGNLREFMNQVHGKTFGIQEKTYSDTLGARWLASSWVSLDLAISVIYAFGVNEIGPLSLQSIAVRETTSRGILERIEQLEHLHISIGNSNYAKAVRQLATEGNEETLRALVQSDIHPDIFDDLDLQRRYLASCVDVGDLEKYRLVISIRLAVAGGDVADYSNRLLRRSLNDGRKEMVVNLLEEMSTRGIPLSPLTSHAISGHIITCVSPHRGESPPGDVDFYIDLSRRIAAKRWPLAAHAWQVILALLGRLDRLEELESLCLEIVAGYQDVIAAGKGTVNIHKYDVPDAMRGSLERYPFHLIPRDLSMNHQSHPVHRIFDSRMQGYIIRWGFLRPLDYGKARSAENLQREVEVDTPARYSIARGVRLLATLRDKGVRVSSRTAARQTISRLGDLYAPCDRLMQPRLQRARRANPLDLAAAKRLCDQAWGSQLLPPLPELETLVQENRRSRFSDL